MTTTDTPTRTDEQPQHVEIIQQPAPPAPSPEVVPDEQPQGDELQQPADAPAEDESDEGGNGRAGREAARYRRQLRETEAALEVATGRLSAARRGLVEQTAAAILADPSALWLVSDVPDRFFTEDGALNAELVKATAKGLVDTFTPQGGRRRYDPIPGQGTGHQDRVPRSQWREAFTGTSGAENGRGSSRFTQSI